MQKQIYFDYFYGGESELFSYYRIPKLLITGDQFKNLSTDAKLLYGLLLDRMSLSAKNGWYDSSGRVYIYYPLDAVEADLCCGHGKAVRLMAELDSGTGIGLIERVRQGLCKPSIIYVKQFTSRAVPPPAAPLVNNDVEPFEVPKSNVRMFDTKTSGLPIIEPSEVSKLEIGALAVYMLASAYFYSNQQNRRPGVEHGSAHWGNVRELNRKYSDKDPGKNVILTQHLQMSLNARQHFRNLLQIIVGGSGAGKSRSLILPNLLLGNASFIVTDPKGELLRSVGAFLLKRGYVLRVFDLIDPSHSNSYNPFRYIRKDSDVFRLIDNFIKNTTPKNASQNDPFWEKSEIALDSALMLYLLHEAPPEDPFWEYDTAVKKVTVVIDEKWAITSTPEFTMQRRPVIPKDYLRANTGWWMKLSRNSRSKPMKMWISALPTSNMASCESSKRWRVKAASQAGSSKSPISAARRSKVPPSLLWKMAQLCRRICCPVSTPSKN